MNTTEETIRHSVADFTRCALREHIRYLIWSCVKRSVFSNPKSIYVNVGDSIEISVWGCIRSVRDYIRDYSENELK